MTDASPVARSFSPAPETGDEDAAARRNKTVKRDSPIRRFMVIPPFMDFDSGDSTRRLTGGPDQEKESLRARIVRPGPEAVEQVWGPLKAGEPLYEQIPYQTLSY
jgi:hypothetical protein